MVLKVIVALNLAVAVWVIGFRSGDKPGPVLPDTETQFSLDLEVVGAVDYSSIYVVEQRARPNYRIFELDPATGVTETVFTVPEDAIIYAVASSPDGETLALGYVPDFNEGGNGIWFLDLDSSVLSEVLPATEGVFYSDVAWAMDGSSILATQVDRRGEDEMLAVVEVELSSGEIVTSIPNAINPVQVDDTLYYLLIDDTRARRAIGWLSSSGEKGIIEVGDGNNDLDHLVATSTSLRVAVIAPTDDGGITIGEPAEAHGNHDVPSVWWEVELDGDLTMRATTFEPIIVFDAIATEDGIVYATNEGLAIATSERVDIIKSRAIRLVAG